MLPSSELKQVTIKDYLVILKRRIWVILACFIIVTSIATLKTFKQVPVYLATVNLLVETNIPTPLEPVTGVWVPVTEEMTTQSEVLRSRALAKKAIDKLISEGDRAFAGMDDPEPAFIGGIKIDIIRNTRIMRLGYKSTDPIKAAKYANLLADVYIRSDIEKRTNLTTGAREFLEKQLGDIKTKLSDAETALNTYAKENKIISIPDIERKTSSTLEGLKAEEVQLEKEIANLSKRYKSKHPKMIEVTTKLESVNKALEDETNKLLEITDKLKQYDVLKRDVDSNKALYNSLLSKTKETDLGKNLEATNIRVQDYAVIPKIPFIPDRKKDILTGILLGLFTGVGLAIFLEYLDSTVKNAEDIEMYVKLPFLGYIPSAKTEIKSKEDIDLIVYKMSQSRIAEAYRSIRTSIIFSAPEDKPLKTILVTSAVPQEGKTAVAVNLGIIFSRANERVLLIDADMRRSRMYQVLGIDRRLGLSNLLTGTASLDDVIKQTFIPNLFFLSSGPVPPNPAELLSSAKIRVVLEELKSKFDRIVIDSPPITSVADTSILSNMVDGVIDVIRAGFINIDLILRGKQRLTEAKSRVIGAILNDVDLKKEDSYYYYHHYYSEEKKKS